MWHFLRPELMLPAMYADYNICDLAPGIKFFRNFIANIGARMHMSHRNASN